MSEAEEVDTSQYLGAERLTVRVLRTDGFTSDEVMRREISPGAGG